MQQLHERDAQLSNVGRPVSDAEYHHFKCERRRSVCIRNLPFHYTDRELFALVIKLLGCGPSDIEACRVKYCLDRSGIGKPMQLGHVMLRSIAMADEVIELLRMFPRHDGRDLRAEIFQDHVTLTHSRDGVVHYRFDAKDNEPLITEKLIRSHLESSPAFGPLTSLCIKAHHWKRKRGGQSGFGFVTFANDELNQTVKRGHALSTDIDSVQYSFGQIRDRGRKDAALASARPSSRSSLRQSMPYRPSMKMPQPCATAAAVAPIAAAAAAPTHYSPAPPTLLPTYLVTSPLQFATPEQSRPLPPPPAAMYMQLPANGHGPSPWTWLAHGPSNGGGHHSRPAAVMPHEAAPLTSARRFALVRVIDEADGSLSYTSGPGSVIPLMMAPNSGFVLPLPPPPPGAFPPPFPPMVSTMTSYSSDTSHSSSAPSSPHHMPPVMVEQPPGGVGYVRSSLGHHMMMPAPTGGQPLASLPPRDSAQPCGSPSVGVERSTGEQRQMTETTKRGPI